MNQDWRVAALFFASVLTLGVIVGGPLIYSIGLSFYASESFVSPSRWVGLANYVELLADPLFWKAIGNGLLISGVAIVLQVSLGISIALVLNQQFFGRSLVRAVAVLPYLLPTVVACLVVQWMLDPNYGLLKSVLSSFGIGMFDWGGNPATAMGVIVMVSVWIWTPFVVTCVLAGLQGIPAQLYEAAHVDGASPWKQFWHITLPGLRSVMIVVILLRGIWMFNKFDVIWLLTKGGPLDETETLPTLAFRRAFVEFNLGGGAAVATMSFLLLAMVMLVYLRLFPIDETRQGR
ncbi:MAG: sugar ABC transporter permease [Pseudomonadota bacterium]|jgi:multiple sugar transport system permease protein